MMKVVLLNPKGGSGKTTLATNLASYYAAQGRAPVLMDYDSQGSSTYWASQRPAELPGVHNVAAFRRTAGVTRSWLLRLPRDTGRVVVDTPAGIELHHFTEVLREAGAIIVPVLPSDVDIHAASRCIADLLLVCKVSRRENRIAVVANRVRRNTLVFKKLESFLESLGIPFIATLRDTQNYVKAFEQGKSVFEIDARGIEQDVQSWQGILQWLDARDAPGENHRVPGEPGLPFGQA